MRSLRLHETRRTRAKYGAHCGNDRKCAHLPRAADSSASIQVCSCMCRPPNDLAVREGSRSPERAGSSRGYPPRLCPVHERSFVQH